MSKPGLTLHRLELFLSVLDAGGVGRAAQARRVSQPAVSEHLRGLEAFFGVPLFERTGRGVRPTAAARLIEPFVRQALGLVTSAEQAAIELRGIRAGAVAVGASTTPGTYLLPEVLGRFHTVHPQIALRLRIGDTREVEQWVAAGAVELGVIGAAPVRPGLVAEPWVKDELVAIVARRHELARRRMVSAAALAQEPYISREEGSSTRAVAEQCFAQMGLTLRPVMELGSTDARSASGRDPLTRPSLGARPARDSAPRCAAQSGGGAARQHVAEQLFPLGTRGADYFVSVTIRSSVSPPAGNVRDSAEWRGDARYTRNVRLSDFRRWRSAEFCSERPYLTKALARSSHSSLKELASGKVWVGHAAALPHFCQQSWRPQQIMKVSAASATVTMCCGAYDAPSRTADSRMAEKLR